VDRNLNLFVFAALVLKDDLLEMLSKEQEYCYLEYGEPWSVLDMCCDFIVSLLHHRTRIFYTPRSFNEDYDTSRGSFAEKKQNLNIKLMTAVARRCQGLRLMKAEAPYGVEANPWFRTVILPVLPQLVNLRVLRVSWVRMDNSDLQQIAMGLPNLV
jgi:hypothetical protein